MARAGHSKAARWIVEEPSELVVVATELLHLQGYAHQRDAEERQHGVKRSAECPSAERRCPIEHHTVEMAHGMN